MIRGIIEVTDEHNITHHVRGTVRFVRLPKGKRRKNPAKQGYYVTRDGCRWWCTKQPIPANTPAAPGRDVDCMSCLVNPPEKPQPRPYKGLTTDRFLSQAGGVLVAGTPSGRETQIFDVQTRSTRSITTGRRIGRRR